MAQRLPAIDPARAVLLILDVQAFVLGPIAGADRLVETLATTIATARAAGTHIGYVRTAFDDADYAAIPAANKALASLIHMAAHRPMHKDHPATAVHERLAPQPGDVVVRKTRVGAFTTTDLDDRLRSAGLDTVVLAGATTSGVVLSTLREAADRDYRVFVLADATADPHDDVHTMLTEKVFPAHAHVLTTTDLAGLLTLAPSRS